VIGAGTVLSPEGVAQVAAAGAKFVVAPNIQRDVVRATKDHGLVSVPGAFTATEIYEAHLAGADMVKVFPSGPVGPGYLKAICGPLDMIKFVATGGIDLASTKSFLDAGATAVGLGNTLVPTRFDGSPKAAAELTERARGLMASIQRNPAVQMA